VAWNAGVDNFSHIRRRAVTIVLARPDPRRFVPAASAASRHRHVAIDVRLIIGIVLVIGSIAGVMAVVSASDHRVTVYAASSSLSPGDRIDTGDLTLRQVSLDSSGALYLAPDDLPDDGLVAVAVVRAGELVPLSAVGSRAGERSTSLVLHLDVRVSSAVVPGALVDVWSAAATSEDIASLGAFGPPTVLASDAVVVRVVDDEGIIAGSDGDSVEVLVPRLRIARLLQAIANGDALAIVPAGIPLGDR
jgi:hypothetical protein